MRKKISFFFIIILLVGCSNTEGGYDIESQELLNYSQSELLYNAIEMEFGNQVTDIVISEVNMLNNDLFISFLFNKKGSLYHGVMYANELDNGEYELGFIEGTEVFDHTPITILNISGQTINSQISQRIHIVTGYINKKDIKSVYVEYPENTQVSALMLDDNQETYTEVMIGSELYPSSIKAFTESGDLIYEKKY